MTENRKSETRKPTADLAARYRCNARTIRNWRKQGAPLDDPEAMRQWLAQRKNLPPNLCTDGITEDAAPEAESTESEAEGRKGAGGALARLERAELGAYDRLQKAIAAGDPVGIKVARSNWLTLCEQLRKYESAVSEDKRRAGQLVPREQIESALRMLGFCLHVGSESALNGLVLEIKGEQSTARVHELIRRAHYTVAHVAYAEMFADRVPQWIIEAVASHYLDATTATRDDLERIGQVIREASEEMTAKVIEAVPKQGANQ